MTCRRPMPDCGALLDLQAEGIPEDGPRRQVPVDTPGRFCAFSGGGAS